MGGGEGKMKNKQENNKSLSQSVSFSFNIMSCLFFPLLVFVYFSFFSSLYNLAFYLTHTHARTRTHTYTTTAPPNAPLVVLTTSHESRPRTLKGP